MRSEVYTIFPIFLVVDVSASMAGGAIEALNNSLPAIKSEMLTNPTIGEIARISIVTFSDVGRTILPLCDLIDWDIPEIAIEGGTNFAAGLRETRQAITSGLADLPKGTPIYRPVVFFMSDGEHQSAEDWEPALNELKDPRWKFSPEVVAFGFGNANADALRHIATRFAFLSTNADPGSQIHEIVNADLLLFSWAVWQCRAQAAAGEHRHGDEGFGCVESVGAFGQCS